MASLHIYQNDAFIKEIPLYRGHTTIGRNKKCDIVLENLGISSQHARIINHGDRVILKDLDSSNGTILNGEKIKQANLTHDDEITIGNKHHLKFISDSVDYTGLNPKEKVAQAENNADKTLMMDPNQMNNILKEKSLNAMAREGNITIKLIIKEINSGEAYQLKLEKKPVVIGTGKGAKIQISGWFAPKIAAIINHRQESYFVIPHKRGKVFFNNKRIDRAIKLKNQDRFRVNNLEIQFKIVMIKNYS